MNETTLAHFTEHGLAEFPREACGLIIVKKGREEYVPCRNQAETPTEHFVLHPEDYASAEDAGDIVAVCHTHPRESGKPSDADRTGCEESGLPWLILPIDEDGGELTVGAVTRIEPCGYEAPLVGRRFVHGVHDCYSIIRDWYKRERGIVLPNYARHDDWWEKGDNLYMDNVDRAGFVAVSGPLEVGDMILMQIRSSVPNHAAVYLGDGIILHHMHGRLSTRDVYGGYWAEVTVKYMRYMGAGNAD